MLINNIQSLRNHKKIKQEELAEILKISRRTLSKWENGEAYPTIDKVYEISKFFNVPIYKIYFSV